MRFSYTEKCNKTMNSKYLKILILEMYIQIHYDNSIFYYIWNISLKVLQTFYNNNNLL